MKKGKAKRNLFKGCKPNKMKDKNCCRCGGIYFLGFIGSLVYYIQNSTSFWNGVVGILKAIVWPAILVYKLLGFIGA
ncbi:hypothetical protein ACFLZF_00575 [Nanoarchaeota archaeon]